MPGSGLAADEAIHSPTIRQAFLVCQGLLVFTEHFIIANDSSTYVTDPHSHVPKLYFRDLFNTRTGCAGDRLVPRQEADLPRRGTSTSAARKGSTMM